MEPKEIYDACMAGADMPGSPEENVERTGVLLAEADATWTRLKNAGEPTGEAIHALLVAALFHCSALEQVSMTADALSTRLVALCSSMVDGSEEPAVDHIRLAHWVFSFNDMMAALSQVPGIDPAANEQDADHIKHVTGYIASMISHCYDRSVNTGADSELLGDAGSMLKMLHAVVEKPLVDVNGTMVDPGVDALPLMADLMGRLRALGVFIAD